MRVLAVKQPWASLIAEGKKSIEVRSRPTNIRERVAIYATCSKYDKRAIGFGQMWLPRGYIIATAEIVGCEQYETGIRFIGDEGRHMVPCGATVDIDAYGGFYGWHLSNVEKLETPIKFKMPKGCVVWASVELDL